MMLPPPITIAISTPSAWTSRISSAIPRITVGAMPKPFSPARPSPESLMTIRRWAALAPSSGMAVRPQPEPHEAGHGHLGAELLARAREQLLDGPIGVLHERLLEQRHLGVELLEAALDDLLDHLLGLAALRRLLREQLALALDEVGRHAAAVHRHRRRIGRGDVHR